MNIPKNGNLKYVLTILALVLYVGVKDVVVPLVKGVTEEPSRQTSSRQTIAQELVLENRLTSLETLMLALKGVPTLLAEQGQILKNLDGSVQDLRRELKEHVREK